MTRAPTNTSRVQHKATISVYGRNIDIHAPPWASIPQLEAWLAEVLREPGRSLVSKSWDPSAAIVERSDGYQPRTRSQAHAQVDAFNSRSWLR